MEIKHIDIGVNLMGKQFDQDRDQVVGNALADGVGLIITGTDIRSNRAAASYISAKRPESTWCTCGIHPHNADQWNPEYREQLMDLISRNQCIIALGEAGLDYDRMFSTRDNQKKCFSDILDMAESTSLPLFLHERAAEDDFIKMLKGHRNLCRRSVVHCFTGTRAAAYRYLQLGCSIGITGWICDDRRNRDLVEAVKLIPLDRLMVETDAPYLTPLHIKGLPKRNIPENIKYVTEKIALIKGVDTELVRQAAIDNTRAFFNID